MNPKILYVDDENNVRVAVSKMLERLGCVVEAVEHGFLAIDAAKKTRYDLVLLDYRMPELDGVETSRFLRKLDDYADVPLIGISGFTDDADVERFEEAGINEFVAKPVAMYKFQEILAKWVPGYGESDS